MHVYPVKDRLHACMPREGSSTCTYAPRRLILFTIRSRVTPVNILRRLCVDCASIVRLLANVCVFFCALLC